MLITLNSEFLNMKIEGNLMKENLNGLLIEYSFRLIEWYKKNSRDLPWRHTKNPYIIWISEIILQQTRVNQGLEYFNRFVKRFPDVASLAAAPEDEVLKYWQGLGYYSRARNLHAAAKQIMEQYNGEFPTKYEQVLTLKGIGEYTAAAICSFSFGFPYAVLDGNVYRVLSRLFAIETPINLPKAKKEFQELAQQLLNEREPALHNQAIMEFGALQCVPVSPNCAACVLQEKCLAFATGRVGDLPVKIKAAAQKNRYFNYVMIVNNGYTYLKKRVGKDIWKNLYEFPLIESEGEIKMQELPLQLPFLSLTEGIKIVTITPNMEIKHVLSHQIINASFYVLHVAGENEFLQQQYIKIPLQDIHDYPVSRLMEMFIEKQSW